MALAGIEALGLNSTLPTNYDYYTAGGIKTGLGATSPNFTLNNRELFIYSGAFHYFRVPRVYWRDRLRKIRAAGLNTVETYIPWNLHEPHPGVFDFGSGASDMSDFLILEDFVKAAREEDLFVIIRTGPYICSEFEFGGLPSWLLREEKINIRTSDSVYMNHVKRFFNVLLTILASFQFIHGGPIIMFQVENEYSISGKHDLTYMKELREIIINKGIKELLVTADNPDRGTYGTISDLYLMTGNFNTDPKKQLDMLKAIQPNKPKMAMEYWAGGTAFWGYPMSAISLDLFKRNYEEILKYPASANIYMFIGSTSYGFMNGAQNLKYDDEDTDYHAFMNSYDCQSPITEAGDYTEKYWATKELVTKYNPVKTKLPDAPHQTEKVAYSKLTIQKQLYLYEILQKITPIQSSKPIPMERLNINNNSGQSYGYVVYRKTNLTLQANSVLNFEGRVCDTFMVLVNGILVSPWIEHTADVTNSATSHVKNPSLELTKTALQGATLDIIVENWGRANVGVYKEYKGIWQGGVKLNNNYFYDWAIYPLEFKKSWTNSLSDWSNYKSNTVGPALYGATLQVTGTPKDTFVYMENWIKGIVIINGFVLGRYAKMGPIQTLYLPAPLLKSGSNNIYIFEHYKPDIQVLFVKNHVYKNN